MLCGTVQNIVVNMSVSLFVSLLAYLRNHAAELFTEFLCMLPMSMALSSCDSVAIRCVLPVLWMASRFHTVGPVARSAYS